MSLKDVYFSSLKKISSEEVIDLIFYRPLGFLLAFGLKKTFISPNSVTLFGLTLGISCGFVAYFASYEAGALLLLFVNILDCVDGQLARLKQQFSKIGRMLDGFADYFTLASFYIGMGLGFIRDTGNFNYFWLGLFAGISTIFHSALFDSFRTRYLGGCNPEEMKKNINAFSAEKKQTKNWLYKTLLFFYIIYERNQLFFMKKPSLKITDRFIRFLSFIGPTTTISLMVTFAFFHRFDLYCYSIVIGLNSYLLIIFLFKRLINQEKN